MTGRGVLGAPVAFVGYLWGFSLAFLPLLHVLRTGVAVFQSEFAIVDWTVGVGPVVNWTLGVGAAVACLRFRPDVRVHATWVFGLVTVVAYLPFELLVLRSRGVVLGTGYPVVPLLLGWVVAASVGHAIAFRDGWPRFREWLRGRR